MLQERSIATVLMLVSIESYNESKSSRLAHLWTIIFRVSFLLEDSLKSRASHPLPSQNPSILSAASVPSLSLASHPLSLLNMEHFGEIFTHFSEFKVVVCQRCMHAVIPSQISSHLTRKHPSTTPQVRREIVTDVEGLHDVATALDQVSYPEPTSEPVAGLPVYSDGFQCDCGYICHRIDTIQRHCRNVHGWTNARRPGRPTAHGSVDGHQAEVPWVSDVSYQRFFEFRQWAKAFRVTPGVANAASDVDDEMARVEQLFRDATEQERREQLLAGSDLRQETNAWLQFMEWPSHLESFTKDEVLAFILPAADEKDASASVVGEDVGLKSACDALGHLILTAYSNTVSKNVGRSALEIVSKRTSTEPTNGRPLHTKQKLTTLKKYGVVWKKVLRFIWRTSVMDHRPEYKLTHGQRRALATLKQGSRSGRPRTALEPACLDLCIRLIAHRYPANDFDSALISGMAVLGLDVTGTTWSDAMRYGGTLAAIITTARVLVVFDAYTSFQREVAARIRQGSSSEGAEESTESIFLRVQKMTLNYLTLIDAGGKPCPMNRLIQMRAYNMAVAAESKGKRLRSVSLSWIIPFFRPCTSPS